ncbi:hypothetical protein F66182_843 [Fusarium sp. NRRL 66182]|nr:hypothetical protein F66182_843 [Fusarium sp. NRRL 66182]
MEKRYKTSEWDRLRKKWQQEHIDQYLRRVIDMPSTGYFYGGTPHYFTVFPHRDLFVLQIENLLEIDFSELDGDISLGSRMAGFHGLVNLAIEYKPEWGIQMEEARFRLWDLPFLDIFVKAAYDGCGLGKIWFIDHNLKRREDAPPYKEKSGSNEQNAFYASDRKLLEVGCDSMATALKNWRYLDEVGGAQDTDRSESSICFVDELQSWIEDQYDPDDTEAEQAKCQFGLLGWDDL